MGVKGERKEKRRGPIPGDYASRQVITALPAPVQTEGKWSKGQECYHPTVGTDRSLIGLVVSWKFANSPSKRLSTVVEDGRKWSNRER